ncbi:MAG: MFS transporter [Alphaproteobacteria bacterium]|nr:MFS transporter [Alphaproteobacteria bacterium]
MTGRAASLALIALCQVAGLALWFSASAAVPGLIESGRLEARAASLLTTAVQLGFVAGTLLSAILGLADRYDPRRLFAACAVAGALANGAILLTEIGDRPSLFLRFLTGMALAGVYPVGMKLAAGWAERNMGLLIGGLVGALTLGSALPHLFNYLGGLEWRTAIAGASLSALLAAAGILLAGLGPRHQSASAFRPAEAFLLLRQRAILLANAGYLGHMWELYAMWAWIGAFLAFVLGRHGDPAAAAGLAAASTFLVMASGALGAVLAGLLADRVGRTLVTIWAMAISGSCALVIGPVAELGVVALLLVAILWGITVIADSAQFSAAIAELAPARLTGSMLTLQTCLGFLLTVATIQLMPLAIELLTWRYAFSVLAIGPFLGVLAMWRLRLRPEAVRIAGGRR